MNLCGCHVTGGADGIVPGLQKRQLSQQESCRDLSRRKLLQDLQDVRAVVKLPFIVFFRALKAKGHHHNVTGHAEFRTAGIFEMSLITAIPALHSVKYAGKSTENPQNFAQTNTGVS